MSKCRADVLSAVSGHVIPSYAWFLGFWTGTYLPSCRTTVGWSALPNGTAFYEALVAEQTTTTSTPAQVHATGLSEVTRIKTEMEGIIRAVNFTGNFSSFVAHIKADPRFFFTTEEALLTHIR